MEAYEIDSCCIDSLKEACDTKVVELKAITSKQKGSFLEFSLKVIKNPKLIVLGRFQRLNVIISIGETDCVYVDEKFNRINEQAG